MAIAFDGFDNRQQRKQPKLDMQVSQTIKRSQVTCNRLVYQATPQVTATAYIESGAEPVAFHAFLWVAGCRTAIDSVIAGTETS